MIRYRCPLSEETKYPYLLCKERKTEGTDYTKLINIIKSACIYNKCCPCDGKPYCDAEKAPECYKQTMSKKG